VPAESSTELLAPMLDALGNGPPSNVRVSGAGSLPAAFRVTDLAVASIATAGICLDRLMRPDGTGASQPVAVDPTWLNLVRTLWSGDQGQGVAQLVG
jgi:hypothetical protein